MRAAKCVTLHLAITPSLWSLVKLIYCFLKELDTVVHVRQGKLLHWASSSITEELSATVLIKISQTGHFGKSCMIFCHIEPSLIIFGMF